MSTPFDDSRPATASAESDVDAWGNPPEPRHSNVHAAPPGDNPQPNQPSPISPPGPQAAAPLGQQQGMGSQWAQHQSGPIPTHGDSAPTEGSDSASQGDWQMGGDGTSTYGAASTSTYGAQPAPQPPAPSGPESHGGPSGGAGSGGGSRPGDSGGPGGSGGLSGPGGSNFKEASTQAKGFFSKLFDFSFSSYITPSIVKVVYALAIALVVLGWLGTAVAAFSSRAPLGIIVLLILGPLYALFILVIVRITLEFYTAVIRIAEDVNDLKNRR